MFFIRVDTFRGGKEGFYLFFRVGHYTTVLVEVQKGFILSTEWILSTEEVRKVSSFFRVGHYTTMLVEVQKLSLFLSGWILSTEGYRRFLSFFRVGHYTTVLVEVHTFCSLVFREGLQHCNKDKHG